MNFSKMSVKTTTDLDILFGKILKARRLECGFTQLQLATESSLDVDYVSLLERGLREPSLETVFQLARAMDIDVSDFVDDIVKLQNKSSK